MKKIRLVFSMVVFHVAVSAFAATTIKVDSIRQNAPWSAEIVVGFTVSGISDPIDVKVEAFSGETSLGEVKVEGDYLALFKDGSYEVSFASEAIARTVSPVVDDFSVKLTPVASHPTWSVPLYRVYDLTKDDAPVEIITPASILAGEYGTFHWSSGEPTFVSGEAIAYTNLVWTGVTQSVYKTSKLVMRYMPAKDDWVYICGYKNYGYRMTNDFYIAVYETTQAQWKNVTGSDPNCKWTSTTGWLPVESVSYASIRGHNEANYWPKPPATDSFIATLRGRTSDTPFDLPAAYELTYAAESGTKFGFMSTEFDTAAWPDNTPATEIKDGVLVTNLPPARCYSVSGTRMTASVGNFAPSVRGIYDIVGNVSEMCVDWEFQTQGAQRSLGAKANVNLDEPSERMAEETKEFTGKRAFTGSSYDDDRKVYWHSLNYGRGSFDPSVGSSQIGFRLKLPAYGNEKVERIELVGAVCGESQPITVFTRPGETAFWCTATNSTFEVTWAFPAGAKKADLNVVGNGFSRSYQNLTGTRELIEVPAAVDSTSENVYELKLTFDDGTVETATLAVVCGAWPGASATVDYAPFGKPSWHYVGSRAVFPIPRGASCLDIDGVQTNLEGSVDWFFYKYPASAESSSVELSDGANRYSNDIYPRRGAVVIFR